MTRPRIAAIISAIVSSTVGFLVMARWGLAGTLTGAATIPVVYTLVAHLSEQAVDRLSHWGRRRVLRQEIEPAEKDTAKPAESAGPAEGEQLPAKPKIRAGTWAVGLAAAAALAISVYTLTLPEEPAQVRQMIVEKTVVVTVPAEEGDGSDETQPAQNSQTARQGDAGQVTGTSDSTTSSTTSTTGGAGQGSTSGTNATSTTVTSVPDKGAPSSPSTTVPVTKVTTPTTVPTQ